MKRPTRAELEAELTQSPNNFPGFNSLADLECPVCAASCLCCPHRNSDIRTWLNEHPAPDPWFADERFARDPFATGPTLDGKPIGVDTKRLEWRSAPSGIPSPATLEALERRLESAVETRVTDAKTGGQKGVKLERFDLVPFEPFTALARLYGKGALKYAPDNWRRGYAWRLSLGGMLRHVALWAVGKSWDTADGTKDGEIEHDADGKPIHTGEHHLTCAAWHCFTLYVFETQNLGTDDRAKTA